MNALLNNITLENIKKAIAQRPEIRIVKEIPGDADTDDTLVLGGLFYSGLHVQVGPGYYCVVRKVGTEFQYTDGTGDLVADLVKALG